MELDVHLAADTLDKLKEGPQRTPPIERLLVRNIRKSQGGNIRGSNWRKQILLLASQGLLGTFGRFSGDCRRHPRSEAASEESSGA